MPKKNYDRTGEAKVYFDEWIQAKNVMAKTISENTGITNATLSKLRHGALVWNSVYIGRVAAALGIQPHELFLMPPPHDQNGNPIPAAPEIGEQEKAALETIVRAFMRK